MSNFEFSDANRDHFQKTATPETPAGLQFVWQILKLNTTRAGGQCRSGAGDTFCHNKLQFLATRGARTSTSQDGANGHRARHL